MTDCFKHLELENAIDRGSYHYLFPGAATPCLYGLAKINKEGAHLRPIVSSINSVTYNIAKYLATILAPLVEHMDTRTTTSTIPSLAIYGLVVTLCLHLSTRLFT